MNKWISTSQKYPLKEGYYRTVVRSNKGAKVLKCRFKKAKNGPREYSPNYFIYRKRAVFDLYWLCK